MVDKEYYEVFEKKRLRVVFIKGSKCVYYKLKLGGRNCLLVSCHWSDFPGNSFWHLSMKTDMFYGSGPRIRSLTLLIRILAVFQRWLSREKNWGNHITKKFQINSIGDQRTKIYLGQTSYYQFGNTRF